MSPVLPVPIPTRSSRSSRSPRCWCCRQGGQGAGGGRGGRRTVTAANGMPSAHASSQQAARRTGCHRRLASGVMESKKERGKNEEEPITVRRGTNYGPKRAGTERRERLIDVQWKRHNRPAGLARRQRSAAPTRTGCQSPPAPSAAILKARIGQRTVWR